MIDYSYKRGDIVFVNDSDGYGSEQSGERPAVIIQNDVGNMHSPTVIVAYMTSQSKKHMPTHIVINPSAQTGLKKQSTIMFEQIKTIDKKRITSKTGQISENMIQCIDRAISISLGLCSAH